MSYFLKKPGYIINYNEKACPRQIDENLQIFSHPSFVRMGLKSSAFFIRGSGDFPLSGEDLNK